MNSRQLNIILGSAVVILLAVVGYMALRNNSQVQTLGQQNAAQNNNAAQSNNSATESLNNDTADIQSPDPSNNKTYTSAKYSFQIEIPNDWTYFEAKDGVRFISAKTQAAYDENKKNCDAHNVNCNPEQSFMDVSFSVDTRVNNAIPGTTVKQTVNGIVFTKYTEVGLTDYYTYETARNGKFYLLSSYQLGLLEPIVKTFQFTKLTVRFLVPQIPDSWLNIVKNQPLTG